jgi:hypothetical protein
MVIGKHVKGYSTVECIKTTYEEAKTFAKYLNDMNMVVEIKIHNQVEFIL